MRVYELAKKHNMSAAELIDVMEGIGIKNKKNISGLSEEEAGRVESALRAKTSKKAAAGKPETVKPVKKEPAARKPAKAEPAKKEPATPKPEKAEPAKKEPARPPIKEKKHPKETPTTSFTGMETVKELAGKFNMKPSELLKLLISKGVMVNINQSPGKDGISDICKGLGFTPVFESPVKKEPAKSRAEEPEETVERAPIVTIMGHVDHGKTTILDTLRKSSIANREFGQITQKIGAYKLKTENGEIVFIDTPGHEAFTEMRSRGALATDIVVLVVDAEEGGKPQTFEAIDHAKSANVPIIVALNKIDKPNIRVDEVKRQLSEAGLVPDEWGGETVYVQVSGETGEGLETLLEMILLVAEMLELKSTPEGPAEGIIIESNLDKFKGPVLTVLVKKGTLRVGDSFAAGTTDGKVRAIINDWGERLDEAGPSTPVEILGSNNPVMPGETLKVAGDERTARRLAEQKKEVTEVKTAKKLTLQDMYSEIQKGETKEVNIILKTDFLGSIDAVKDVVEKIPQDEIKISVIHAAAGPVNESDILLASASNALVLGFNTNTTAKVEEISKREGVEVRLYRIIYELADELKKAVEGMLEPEEQEILSGQALVKKVYNLSDKSTIAGCLVVEGRVVRNSLARLVRKGEVIYRGSISSLKRFKENVTEVKQNMECGIGLSNFNEIQQDDIIQSYQKKKVPKKL